MERLENSFITKLGLQDCLLVVKRSGDLLSASNDDSKTEVPPECLFCRCIDH